MPGGFDQEIVQDFLTESGELLSQLEVDLVSLEATPREEALLNQVFRALHTIKGSASFLQLGPLVRIAHAAESALNAARNGVISVGPRTMNLLLEAVDLIKTQMNQLGSSQTLSEPRDELVAALASIGEGQGLDDAPADAEPASASQHADAGAPGAPPAEAPAEVIATRPLALGPGKADLVEYLVADLEETIAKVRTSIDGLSRDTAPSLIETCEALSRCVDFFEFAQMNELTQAMAKTVQHAGAQPESALAHTRADLAALCHLVTVQAAGIKLGEVREVAARDLLDRLSGVAHAPAGPAGKPAPSGDRPVEKTIDKEKGEDKPGDERAADTQASKKAPAMSAENTVRVEVGRLETLMNLVGELVLQKNRVASLARRVASSDSVGNDLAESLTTSANGLDRVTSDIQMAVMRTRMQPLDKLFGRYPRLIRDLATKTGKKIQLAIEGGETEVDKSVIEELGDPLVHLIRNAADHGLEPPDERERSGKPATGTITLRATHEGSNVRVLVIDDGRGLSRERIARKAVERGLATAESVAQMPDSEVFNFIFEAGFSTAEQVSDLSGRGVGMDVVRTNIHKLKGQIELSSKPGAGTTVCITIPLTVAILHAMMVGVGNEIYALPLTSILEIVRPTPEQVFSIGASPVLRLRDGVLPLISAAEVFRQPVDHREGQPFAVILQSGQRRAGLMVTRLIGQQEVVIKPLDDSASSRASAVSGATVRDDGGVSLIVDVEELVRSAQG